MDRTVGWLKDEILSSVEEYILDVRKTLPQSSKTAQAIDHGFSWTTLAHTAADEGYIGFAEEIQAATIEQNLAFTPLYINAEPAETRRYS